MSKDLWLQDYEVACDEFAGEQIDEAEFTARMKQLGFDPGEINDHISALSENDEQLAQADRSPDVNALNTQTGMVP